MSAATCLHVACCFSELAYIKTYPIERVDLVKGGYYHPSNLTSSRHVIRFKSFHTKAQITISGLNIIANYFWPQWIYKIKKNVTLLLPISKHRGYFTPLYTIFQLYRGGQFYWWRKPQYPKKHRLEEINDNLYHIILYWVHFDMSGIRTKNVSCDRHRLHR